MTKNQSPLVDRYGADAASLELRPEYSKLQDMLSRGSCRSFQPDPVDFDLIQLLCATALASPTKSDLQQRDIVVLRDDALRSEIAKLVSAQSWVAEAPCLLVFCGNNQRQRRLHELRGHPFVNDHLDAFFNAAVDAGIALSAFVTAAEAAGLGCCPISALRNESQKISDLLNLPQFVYPVAGLGVGYPAEDQAKISPRLALGATVHFDRYDADNIDDQIAAYDERRNNQMRYYNQRAPIVFGTSMSYGWSEDKARQYAQPERQDFGSFIRSKGFNLT